MTGDLTDRWTLASAFDRAAPTYDAMVALSPGYHDQLRSAGEAAAEALGRSAGPEVTALDLGCGSGASTRELLAALTALVEGGSTGVTLTGVDASAGMLAQARAKTWPPGVSFVHDDALAFLRTKPAGSTDAVLTAYLLRNVPDRDALLDEVRRVLRPGGVLVVHDYSVAGSRRAQLVWALVCHLVIIPLSHVKRSDPGLHRYLYRSVRDFDSVEAVGARLTRAGFTQVRHRSYAGWQRGLVHTVVGRVPV
ncbi:MAG: class I SAM-dependent methyltransferase [Dermatophilaceae bacterium]